jgi:hypothetical protein
VAVRRNTAIPDGDPLALGAGLMSPPKKRVRGGINPRRIKIKTEIRIRMKIKSGIKTEIRIEFNSIQFAGLPRSVVVACPPTNSRYRSLRRSLRSS